jgi:hypothetical protein
LSDYTALSTFPCWRSELSPDTYNHGTCTAHSCPSTTMKLHAYWKLCLNTFENLGNQGPLRIWRLSPELPEQIANYFSCHPELHHVRMNESLTKVDILPCIKAERLHIQVTCFAHCLSSAFAVDLFSSVKALEQSRMSVNGTFGADSRGQTIIWKILDQLVASSSALSAVHVLSTEEDAFRWVEHVNRGEDEQRNLRGRLFSYVPLLEKRGIRVYDHTRRIICRGLESCF